MSRLNRLLGRARKALDQSGSSASRQELPLQRQDSGGPGAFPTAAPTTTGGGLPEEDHRAIARYAYLLRTAESEQLEQVHSEAFASLTPYQRAQLTGRLRSELPDGERPHTDAPDDLARSATRLGVRDPRGLKGLLARAGQSRAPAGGAALTRGGGCAGSVGAGLLATVAGGAVTTGIGDSLLREAVRSGIDVDTLAGGFALEQAAQDGLSGVNGTPDGEVVGLGDRLPGSGPDHLPGR